MTPVSVNGHEVVWEDVSYPLPGSVVYGTVGVVGMTQGQSGRPPYVVARCRDCGHAWSSDIDPRTWDRLQTVERRDLGDALARRVVMSDPLTCDDRRALRVCREVMET